MSKRGRKKNIEECVVIEKFMQRKSELFLKDGQVCGKNHNVWQLLSSDLNNELSPRTLYSRMFNKEFLKLLNLNPKNENDSQLNASNEEDMEINEDSTYDTRDLKFKLYCNKEELEKMIIEKVYTCREKGKIRERHYYRFKPGLWEIWLSDMIYDHSKLKCGFNFLNHQITRDKGGGQVNADCNCGSSLSCIIDNATFKEETEFACCIKMGDGKTCGKRYLRDPIRSELAKNLCSKPPEIYRAEEAGERMELGDPEPPTLSNLNVLKNAVCEYKKKQYLDPSPRISLEKMALSNLGNVIQEIGLRPFFAIFWMLAQTHAYLSALDKEPVNLQIDASGSIISRIRLADNSLSGPIFLYLIVINTDAGQLSVSQMISEKHTAVAILKWLLTWANLSGIPTPREITCDSSVALLTAAVRAFTPNLTIADYALSCEKALPNCYIRIDNAHFMQTYSKFLKKNVVNKNVRIFYKAAIGQLIQSRNAVEASRLLKAIFIIAHATTDGKLIGANKNSNCQTEKNYVTNLTNPDYSQANEDDEYVERAFPKPEADESLLDDFAEKSAWFRLATKINTAAMKNAETETGDHDNAHFLPSLAEKLLKNVSWICLWSNVYRDEYGYGNTPASTSGVEAEFNNVKNKFLSTKKTPMRADVFVQSYINDYLKGRTNIFVAKQKDNLADSNLTQNSCENSLSKADCVLKSTLQSDPIKLRELHNEVLGLKINAIENRAYEDIPSTETEMSPLQINVLNKGDKINFSKTQKDAFCPEIIETRNFQDLSEADTLEESDSSVEEDNKLCELCFRFNNTEYNICQKCSEQTNVAQILEGRSLDDWKGLATKHEKEIKLKNKKCSRTKTGKTSKYLEPNKNTHDALFSKNLVKIPIFPNGNSPKLAASKIGKKQYSLTNTCAFDSIFQIFLVAACDRTNVKDTIIHLKSKVPLFELIKNIMKNGITSGSYRKRAVILEKIVKIGNRENITYLTNNNILINCEISVGYLAEKMLTELPSFTKTLACVANCKNPTSKPRTSLFIVDRSRLENGTMFNNLFELKEKKCTTPGCSGTIKQCFTSSGPFIIIEVNYETAYEKIKLCEIQQSIKDPANSNDTYQLIGAVLYFGPNPIEQRRSSENFGVAHFTAVCCRQKRWMEFNDLRPKGSIPLNEKFSVMPSLLFYSRLQR